MYIIYDKKYKCCCFSAKLSERKGRKIEMKRKRRRNKDENTYILYIYDIDLMIKK
jgi:hypothetical protein